MECLGATQRRAVEVLEPAVLHQGMSVRLFRTSQTHSRLGAVDWDFIVAKMGKDKGILGHDFAVAIKILVRLHQRQCISPELRYCLTGSLENG